MADNLSATPLFVASAPASSRWHSHDIWTNRHFSDNGAETQKKLNSLRIEKTTALPYGYSNFAMSPQQKAGFTAGKISDKARYCNDERYGESGLKRALKNLSF